MVAQKKVRLGRPERRTDEKLEARIAASRTRVRADGAPTPSPARSRMLPPSLREGEPGACDAAAPARTREATTNRKVTDLLTSANELTPAERKELLARLSLAESLKGGEVRDVDMWSEAVYEALGDALGQGAAGLPAPLAVKRLLAAPASWRPVEDFMGVSRFSGLKVTERQSVYSLLARLLVVSAKEMSEWSRIPFSAKLVAQRAPQIAGVFEQSFPGYIAAGLALIVAKRLTRSRA